MSGGKPAKPVVVEAVEETPSTLPYTFSPREGVDYLSSVTVGKDPNLVPENVKKDVSIFGTTGTYEGSGGGSGGDYSSVFDVFWTNIRNGAIGSTVLRVSDTPGTLPSGSTAGGSGYWRISTDRLYTVDGGGWFLHTPASALTNVGYGDLTVPETPAGTYTRPVSEISNMGQWYPWPDTAFTAHGTFFYGIEAVNGNVFNMYDSQNAYEADIVSDGVNVTITHPLLESFETPVYGYPSGAGTQYYPAISPYIVEVKFT